MSDLENLCAEIERCRTSMRGHTRIEKDIENNVIRPILAVLGWDFFTTERAESEYKINGKPVDFVLKSNRRNPVIFIEVKNLGQLNTQSGFTSAQDQLFGYFDDYGHKRDIQLLLLTDGDKWFFYKPRFRDYRPDELMFKKISLLDENPQEMADLLSKLLSIEFVDDGTFNQNVEDAFNAHVDYRKAQEVFPEFMRSALKEPSEELCQIIADSFRNHSGIETLATSQIRNLISNREDDYEKAKKAFPNFWESELREPSEGLAEEIGRTFSDVKGIDLDLPAIQSLIKNHRLSQPSKSAVEDVRPSYQPARSRSASKELIVALNGKNYTGTQNQKPIAVIRDIGTRRVYDACREGQGITHQGSFIVMQTHEIDSSISIRARGAWRRIDGEYELNTKTSIEYKLQHLEKIRAVLGLDLTVEIR